MGAPRPVDVTVRGKNETKPAFDSAIKDAESFGARMKASLLNPINVVQGAAIALVATLGTALVGAVSGFARSSVESAASADAAWGRVQSAVTNAGMSFDLARGPLDRLFASIQKTTRFSDDQAAEAFATLVRMSGDYTGSIKTLTLVTDVAAAKSMDLVSAAELVGKVMAGEEGGLKRVGVVLREGESGMDGLRRQFAGFAGRDASTLSGKLSQIANAWDNVKEAVGRALTEVDETGQSTNRLTTALNDLGGWIDTNGSGVLDFFSKLATPVKGWAMLLSEYGKLNKFSQERIGTLETPEQKELREGQELKQFQDDHAKHVLEREARLEQVDKDKATRAANARKAATEAAKKREEEQAKAVEKLKQEYSLLVSIGRVTGTTDFGKQARIEREMAAIAKDPSQAMAARAAAADFTADRKAETDRALAKFHDSPSDLPGFSLTPSRIGRQSLPVTARPITATYGQAGLGAQIASQFTANFGGADAFAGVDASLGSLDERMKSFTGGTLANMFTVWQEGIGEVIHQHNVLGTVVPAMMRKAAGGGLAADAQDTMLRAAKAAALALTDPSGIHALQALRLFSIGSLEMGAAAALSGGGGGYGGGGGGISTAGFSQVQSDMGGRGKVTIVLPRGIDSYSEDELAALKAAMQELDSTRDLEFLFGGQR